MEIFLLIAPYLVMMELAVIACCLVNQWLDVFKDWHIEKLRSRFIARNGFDPFDY